MTLLRPHPTMLSRDRSFQGSAELGVQRRPTILRPVSPSVHVGLHVCFGSLCIPIGSGHFPLYSRGLGPWGWANPWGRALLSAVVMTTLWAPPPPLLVVGKSGQRADGQFTS